MSFLLTLASRAHAGNVRQECVDAAEHAQQLRDERSFVAATTMAITCSRPECPAVLQRDCAELVADLKARTPSVVVRVRTRGRDRFDASVTLDGKPVELTGGTISIDPGRHVLRAVAPGARPAEQAVLAVEREHARVVDLTLDDEPEAAPPSTPAVAAVPVVVPGPAVVAGPSRSIPPEAWVAGGVGITGVAGFIYFGLKARSDIAYLTTACAPRCTDEQIAYPQAKRIAADVSLGVGVIGLGLATWFILRTPKREVHVGYLPTGGGGMAMLSGAL
ncbi:MAG: hypothetical protein QOI41_4380 [Myxococcales bacterium]|nr:hypothetical protein [Myxococcales bacterium]